MGPNDQLLDDTISSALLALRFSEGVRRDTVGLFEAMLAKVRSIILGSELDSTWSRGRVESLILLIGNAIEEHYIGMEARLEALLVPFAEGQTVAASRSLQKATGQPSQPVPRSAAAALVFDTNVLGGPMTEYIADQSTAARRAAARTVRLATAGNLNAAAVADRVVGTTTGRRMSVTNLLGAREQLGERRGGALDAARNYMNSLSRSAAMAVQAAARELVFDANRDSIRGLAAVVTLDGRTSKICMSRSGGAWNPTTGKPLAWSTVRTPFPGYPPWHLNCRTTLTPVIAGDPPQQLTYPEWLSTRSAAEQRDILGASRYKMWKEGNLDLHQMLDVSGRPLRLEELQARS